MIWFGESSSLAKPMISASSDWPIATVSVGCCTPAGNWLSTELIFAVISVIALSGSKFSTRLAVIVLVPDLLFDDR